MARARRRRCGTWIVVSILGLDVLGTVWGWYATRAYEVEYDRQRFLRRVEEARTDISKRMLDHELILRAGRSLFAASTSVSREEWRTFVRCLDLTAIMPGIQGVGFARYVPPAEREAFVAGVRAEGFADFHLWPDGEREAYSSIVFLEPFEKRNLRAFGYDMLSESVRRAAMTTARDSGVPAVSGRVRLVQETETDVQHGILMYYPVYRNGLPAATVEERRAALLGWAYSPYRMNDLMKGILGGGAPEIDLEIFDGAGIGRDFLLYDADGALHADRRNRVPMFETSTPVRLYGRTWTLRFETNPDFEARASRGNSLLVLAVGSVVTVLVGVHLVHTHRERVREAALLAAARDATVGRMAATVAHEVNNPLAAIKGRLDVLREELPAGTEAAGDVAAIEGQIDRIGRTVRALLGFARQREAKGAGAPTAEIVRAVAGLFEESLRAKGIALAVEISEGLPSVALPSDRLQDVLVNLLENAREAMDGGAIRLSAAARADVGAVEIVVEDDGPGLGPEPEGLFRSFRTTKSDGTGLGLSVARRACESWGGRLTAENRPEGGARFRVLLPVAAG